MAAHVHVRFDLQESDIADAVRAMPQMAWLRLGGGVALMMACLALGSAAISDNVAGLLPGALLGAVIGGLLLLSPRFAAKKALENFRAEEKSVAMTFSEEGFALTSGKGDASIPWQAMHRVVEGRRGFLFYVSEQLAHYLPGRVLGDDDAKTIRALAHAGVQPRQSASQLKRVAALWVVLAVGFALSSVLLNLW